MINKEKLIYENNTYCIRQHNHPFSSKLVHCDFDDEAEDLAREFFPNPIGVYIVKFSECSDGTPKSVVRVWEIK